MAAIRALVLVARRPRPRGSRLPDGSTNGDGGTNPPVVPAPLNALPADADRRTSLPVLLSALPPVASNMAANALRVASPTGPS